MFYEKFKICFRCVVFSEVISFEKIFKTVTQKTAKWCKKSLYKRFVHLLLGLLVNFFLIMCTWLYRTNTSFNEALWSAIKFVKLNQKQFLLKFVPLADDAVYMENDEHRNEYVLEDYGYIWKGTSDWPEKTPWNFGQVKSLYHFDSEYASSKIPTPNNVPKTFSSRWFCYHTHRVIFFLWDDDACKAAWAVHVSKMRHVARLAISGHSWDF